MAFLESWERNVSEMLTFNFSEFLNFFASPIKVKYFFRVAKILLYEGSGFKLVILKKTEYQRFKSAVSERNVQTSAIVIDHVWQTVKNLLRLQKQDNHVNTICEYDCIRYKEDDFFLASQIILRYFIRMKKYIFYEVSKNQKYLILCLSPLKDISSSHIGICDYFSGKRTTIKNLWTDEQSKQSVNI